MPIYPNTQIILNDTNLNTTSISHNSINTPSISTKSLTTTNGYGATGSILTNNGSSMQWVASSSQIDPTNIQNDINMNNNNISNATTVNCANLYTSGISGPTTITNPITFNSPPMSVTPTISTHLATKEYVDTTLSSGIYILYFNLSQPVSGTTFCRLSNIRSTSTYVTETTISGTSPSDPKLIKSFLSNPIGITQLPVSLWTFNIYGTIDNITDQTNYYAVCELYRNNSVISTIGISNNSANHIALTSTNVLPYVYKVSMSLSSSITTNPSDQILISLYAYTVSGTGSRNIITYFEDIFPSYVQIQVSTPITLLPSNPTWVSTSYSNLKMNNYNIISNNNMSISCENKLLSLGSDSPVINIASNSTQAITINLNTSDSGSIFINKWFVIQYTTLPTTSQIGQIISVPYTTGNNALVSNQEKLISEQIVPPGVWLVNANSGCNNTTFPSTFSLIELYLKIGSTIICRQQNNMIGGTSGVAFAFTLQCNTFFSLTTSSTVGLYQKVIFTGGVNVVSAAGEFDYNFNFVRVA